MLKADFHTHTNDDPKHKDEINYGAKELIDFAHKKKYDVLAITLHGKILQDKSLTDYAKKKGMLLIPGIEAKIEYQDVLILLKKADSAVEKIKTYEELIEFKRKNKKDIIIIMPHLFYPNHFPIGFITYLLDFFRDTKKRYAVADAFEYSHFYLKWFNPNKRAIRLAKRMGKPMIGNSDMHNLWQMGTTYSLIDSKKDIDSVFAAIRKGDISVITLPFFLKTLVHLINPWKKKADK